MKKEITVDELKNIQLDILQKVHEYCEKENIYYSLAYGTLIGAVRHKGYIPWDDDIDICMPRPDYDKFLCHFNDYNKKYKVNAFELDSSYPYPYAKVMDTETRIYENSDVKYEIGVNIDIFPIDGANEELLKKQCRLRNLLDLKVVKISKERIFYKNIVLLLGKLILLPVSFKKIIKKMDENSKIIPYSKSDYVSCVAEGLSTNHKIKKELFFTRELIEFEDKNFYIMGGYDEYLTSIYGEYMCFPPESKQVSHHVFKAYYI